MEELFFLATDEPCAEEYCAENLANTRALRDAGKFVLAVDYATRRRPRPRGLRPVPRPSGSPATSPSASWTGSAAAVP